MASISPEPDPLAASAGTTPGAAGSVLVETVTEPETRGNKTTPSARVTVLSLYEGDHLNGLWSMIGLGPRRPAHLAVRALLLPLITWLPMAILAAVGASAQTRHGIDAANLFADFAAYAQFWLGLPLFVLAEAIVSFSTRSASLEFAASGVIRLRDLPRLDALHEKFNRLQRRWASDLLCVAVGGVLRTQTPIGCTNSIRGRGIHD